MNEAAETQAPPTLATRLTEAADTLEGLAARLHAAAETSRELGGQSPAADAALERVIGSAMLTVGTTILALGASMAASSPLDPLKSPAVGPEPGACDCFRGMLDNGAKEHDPECPARA